MKSEQPGDVSVVTRGVLLLTFENNAALHDSPKEDATVGKVNVELPLTGSCQRGNITYEANEAPLAALACHCIECQKLTSSAYSTVLVFKTESIQFAGEFKSWERTSDSGRRNIAYFCPVCGNRIYHFDPDMPAVTRLKSGTIDNQPIPEPEINQWLSRSPDWVCTSETAPRYQEGMPPEERKKLVGLGFRPDD